MNRLFIVLGLAAALAPIAGCGPSLESKLIGRWRADMQSVDLEKIAQEKIQEQAEGNQMAAAMGQFAAAMVKSMIEGINIETEFRPDHTIHSRVSMSVFGQQQEKSQSGTWRVEATGENQLTVAVTMDDGVTNTISIKFLDDNRFTATGSVPGAGDQQVTFIRVNSNAGA